MNKWVWGKNKFNNIEKKIVGAYGEKIFVKKIIVKKFMSKKHYIT